MRNLWLHSRIGMVAAVGLALGSSELVVFGGRNGSVVAACMVVDSAGEAVDTVAAATVVVDGMVRLEVRCWVGLGTLVEVVGVLVSKGEFCEVDARSRADDRSACGAGQIHAARSSCRHYANC